MRYGGKTPLNLALLDSRYTVLCSCTVCNWMVIGSLSSVVLNLWLYVRCERTIPPLLVHFPFVSSRCNKIGYAISLLASFVTVADIFGIMNVW